MGQHRSEVDDPIAETPGGLDPVRIREQLESILASPPFRNSKRYPALLRYLVEHSLNGDTAELKERTLGVEVFGRGPNFDPAEDPIVRTSAAEIRKRLAQYYLDTAPDTEIRIQLPLGSYVPQFAVPGFPAPSRAYTVWIAYTLAIVVVCLAGSIILLHAPAPVNQFWGTVASPHARVMVCVGALGLGNLAFSSAAGPGVVPGAVTWSDVLTLGRLGVFLKGRDADPQFCREDQATFGDFQQGPAVLIGGLNDEWALRLMQNLRFQFRRDGTLFYIADRERLASRDWSIHVEKFDSDGRLALDRDFAVISRVASLRTGRMTVIVGGLWEYGTMAAGRFLTEPGNLESFARSAPSGWERKNLQLIISTEVIEKAPGPPHVVAATYW